MFESSIEYIYKENPLIVEKCNVKVNFENNYLSIIYYPYFYSSDKNVFDLKEIDVVKWFHENYDKLLNLTLIIDGNTYNIVWNNKIN